MTHTLWNALLPGRLSAWLLIGLFSLPFANSEQVEPEEPENPPAVDVGNREVLKLPGIRIHAEKRYVDVDARVCLDAGFLELIACTKDSKEHESVIAVDAKPSHMHAALLLLSAKPGNPAISRLVEQGGGRWIEIAPKGSEVDVFLVLEDAEGTPKEHPISDFIIRGEDQGYQQPEVRESVDDKRFPTNTFLFAGSQLFKGEDGKARYLSDQSGNVISLASFGDELLCLPGKHSQDNGALVWEVDSTHLPPLGSKITLRLKPKQEAPEK